MLIEFNFDTKYGVFADAIWFSDTQELPTEAEIDAIKYQRLYAWLDLIEHPQDAIAEPLQNPQPDPNQ